MTDHEINTVNEHESYCETCDELVPNDHLREHQLDDEYAPEPPLLRRVIQWLRK